MNNVLPFLELPSYTTFEVVDHEEAEQEHGEDIVTKKMAGEMSQFGVDCVVVAESLLLRRLEIKSG